MRQALRQRGALTWTVFIGLFGCIGLIGLYGCAGDGGGPQQPTCQTPCPTGYVCDYQQGACVPNPNPNPNPTPTPSCTPPLAQCGTQCVDLQSDPSNCGGCGQRCGTNAQCNLGRCQCVGSFKNCNGQFFDGCECSDCDPKNPTLCANQNPQDKCNPTQVGSCPSTGAYCDTTSGTADCRPCPQGFLNCDGQWGCECQGTCNGTQCSSGGGNQCDPTQTNACGNQEAFCETGTRQCATCPFGYKNCDGQWGCECQGTCNGTVCNSGNPNPTPQCNTNQRHACGDETFFCDPQTATCKKCDDIFGLFKKRNCDGVGGCEVSGDTCNQTAQCDPTVYNACGNDLWYCDVNSKTCQVCPSGTKNCNGYGNDGCENPSTTCGTQPPPPTCNPWTPWSCGNSSYFCDSNNTCQRCASGYLNCNGTSICEHLGATCGGGGTCDETKAFDCGTGRTDLYCDDKTGSCRTCQSGWTNCNGEYGCETFGSCGSTGCDPTSKTACSGRTDQYCDPVSKTCISCGTAAHNCNKVGTDKCEIIGASCGTTYGTCTWSGGGVTKTGVCQQTGGPSPCEDGYLSGYCPGQPADVLCCIDWGTCTGAAGGAGLCQNSAQVRCNGGTYEAGRCPGPSDIQCCVGGATPGNEWKVWIKKVEVDCDSSFGSPACGPKSAPDIKVTLRFESQSGSSIDKNNLPKDSWGIVVADWTSNITSSNQLLTVDEVKLLAGTPIKIEIEETSFVSAGGTIDTCSVLVNSTNLASGAKTGNCGTYSEYELKLVKK
jgi:hypothetical protein